MLLQPSASLCRTSLVLLPQCVPRLQNGCPHSHPARPGGHPDPCHPLTSPQGDLHCTPRSHRRDRRLLPSHCEYCCVQEAHLEFLLCSLSGTCIERVKCVFWPLRLLKTLRRKTDCVNCVIWEDVESDSHFLSCCTYYEDSGVSFS